jgi:hypothetical protein
MQRIFVIGFNKCGTRSICDWFKSNGLESIHWDNGKLARSMLRRSRLGYRLLHARYRDVRVFSDMEDVDGPELVFGFKMFRELDRQYPGSKFVLNTRPKDAWIRSRCNHQSGRYAQKIARSFQVPVESLPLMWSREWDDHHADVRRYFENRPEDLVVFDIERDQPQKLADFFGLSPRGFRHLGKTFSTRNNKKECLSKGPTS